MEDLSIYAGLGSVPIVVGLMMVVKALLALPEAWEKRVVPILTIAVGVGVNALISTQISPTPALAVVVIFGIISGLAASGLWSGQKAVRGL